jgi:DNA-binding winged helix-turn-helix (wHTH) protein
MDQTVQRALRFESFELDLNRFCVRTNGQSFDLRPKTFEVLRRLAESPGQLVSKDAFYREVWPDVVVGDDSLSQCIHELRQLLGDTAHRLIKTVPRRGYLLDAKPLGTSPAVGAFDGSAGDMVLSTAQSDAQIARPSRNLAWAIALSLLIGAVAGLAGPGLLARAHLSELANFWRAPAEIHLPDGATRRLAALTAEKEVPVPAFQILRPHQDVPEEARRFIGVWVSDEAGWSLSKRQMMMIVTSVDRRGVAAGYLSNGPSKPFSRLAGPAFWGRFEGRIFDRALHYESGTGVALATFTPAGRIEYQLTFPDGGSGMVVLEPVWTLPDGISAVAQ